MYGYAYTQWKIALARMAEYQLNRYFEMVEARLPQFDAGQRCR